MEEFIEILPLIIFKQANKCKRDNNLEKGGIRIYGKKEEI